MKKYRKKPLVVEAFQLGEDYTPPWFKYEEMRGNAVLWEDPAAGIRQQATVKTRDGWKNAKGGDYILRTGDGEIYPLRPDVFLANYAAVE